MSRVEYEKEVARSVSWRLQPLKSISTASKYQPALEENKPSYLSVDLDVSDSSSGTAAQRICLLRAGLENRNDVISHQFQFQLGVLHVQECQVEISHDSCQGQDDHDNHDDLEGGYQHRGAGGSRGGRDDGWCRSKNLPFN